MQLGPQNGFNPISKSAIFALPCILIFIIVSVDRTSFACSEALCSSRHRHLVRRLPHRCSVLFEEQCEIGLSRSRSLSQLRKPTTRAPPREPAPGFEFPLLELRSETTHVPHRISTAGLKVISASHPLRRTCQAPQNRTSDHPGICDSLFSIKHSSV